MSYSEDFNSSETGNRNMNRRMAREYYRSRNRCAYCGQMDAYTIAGRYRCFECQEKINEYKRNHQEYSRKTVEYKQKRADQRRENHLCTICGAKLPTKGYYPYVTCETCRIKSRKRQENDRRDKGVIPRENREFLCLCRKCGAPVESGFLDDEGKPHKLCVRCYEQSKTSLEKARAAFREKYGYAYGAKSYMPFMNMKKTGGESA